MEFFEFFFASGIMGVLFKMSHDLGKIRGQFEKVEPTLEDHEQRLTILESKG